MKSLFTLSCFFTLIVFSVAQPTIQREDIYAPGDKVHSTSPEGYLPDPGEAGANRVWDFSDAPLGAETAEIRIAQPDTTDFFAEYPTSNIAAIVDFPGGQSIQYERASVGSHEALGFVIPGIAQQTYSDPVVLHQFPLTYNTQWVDTYAYVFDFVINPITTETEGTVEVLVDGYGTLLLGTETFPDVLRMKVISESTDTTDLGQGLSEKNITHDTTYIWITPTEPGPLANLSHSVTEHIVYLTTPDTVIVDQETLEDASFSFDPFAGMVDVKDVEPGRFHLSISPNPIERNVTLTFTAERPDEMEFVLQELNGRIVYKEFLVAHAGENTFHVTLPEIPSGMYTAILNASDGADVQKLVRIGSTR